VTKFTVVIVINKVWLLRYSSPTQPEQVLGYVPLDIALLDMDVQQNSLWCQYNKHG
jgi:hypothetical protein